MKLEDIWNLGKLVEVFLMDAYIEKEKLHKVLLEMLNNEDNEISIKSELFYCFTLFFTDFSLASYETPRNSAISTRFSKIFNACSMISLLYPWSPVPIKSPESTNCCK